LHSYKTFGHNTARSDKIFPIFLPNPVRTRPDFDDPAALVGSAPQFRETQRTAVPAEAKGAVPQAEPVGPSAQRRPQGSRPQAVGHQGVVVAL